MNTRASKTNCEACVGGEVEAGHRLCIACRRLDEDLDRHFAAMKRRTAPMSAEFFASLPERQNAGVIEHRKAANPFLEWAGFAALTGLCWAAAGLVICRVFHIHMDLSWKF